MKIFFGALTALERDCENFFSESNHVWSRSELLEVFLLITQHIQLNQNERSANFVYMDLQYIFIKIQSTLPHYDGKYKIFFA